ncbi:MAG TPA: hypothetical protein VKS21_11350 [Spirochaetota bacterium]|nr:hypothetical protein [Spirochaetota bacterium]
MKNKLFYLCFFILSWSCSKVKVEFDVTSPDNADKGTYVKYITVNNSTTYLIHNYDYYQAAALQNEALNSIYFDILHHEDKEVHLSIEVSYHNDTLLAVSTNLTNAGNMQQTYTLDGTVYSSNKDLRIKVEREDKEDPLLDAIW